MNRNIKSALDSARAVMNFSPHDWSSDSKDAWLYGIICGWDESSLSELQTKFRWTDEAVVQLKEYNEILSQEKKPIKTT